MNRLQFFEDGVVPIEFLGVADEMLKEMHFAQSAWAVYAFRVSKEHKQSVEMHMRLKMPWSFHQARQLKEDFREIKKNLKSQGFQACVTSCDADGPDYRRWFRFVGFTKVTCLYVAHEAL